MREFSRNLLNLYKTTYKGLNLTRILDEESFYHKQVQDSSLPAQSIKEFDEAIRESRLVVDIGCGGGFPLLPLANMYPEVRFLGIDARAKKVKAVEEIARSLNLANVKTRHQRLEDIYFDRSCCITFKAVGKIQNFLPKIAVKNLSTKVFFYKGPSYFSEEKPYIDLDNWDLITEKKVNISTDIERYLIGFKLKKVPRGTYKNLVKLTDIL